MFGKRSGSVSPQVAVSRVASVSVVNEAPKPARRSDSRRFKPNEDRRPIFRPSR